MFSAGLPTAFNYPLDSLYRRPNCEYIVPWRGQRRPWGSALGELHLCWPRWQSWSARRPQGDPSSSARRERISNSSPVGCLSPHQPWRGRSRRPSRLIICISNILFCVYVFLSQWLILLFQPYFSISKHFLKRINYYIFFKSLL